MTTQTKTAHTPGPLEAGTIEYGTILKHGLVLYRLCQSVEDFGCGDDQKLADAKLYAAAPDLLDAAKLTVLNFKRNAESGNFLGDDEHEAWTALNDAIQKAQVGQ